MSCSVQLWARNPLCRGGVNSENAIHPFGAEGGWFHIVRVRWQGAFWSPDGAVELFGHRLELVRVVEVATFAAMISGSQLPNGAQDNGRRWHHALLFFICRDIVHCYTLVWSLFHILRKYDTLQYYSFLIRVLNPLKIVWFVCQYVIHNLQRNLHCFLRCNVWHIL